MMKLGLRWEVKQKVQGKKREPAEVAQELDERMRKKARELLTSRGLKPPLVETSPSVLQMLCSVKLTRSTEHTVVLENPPSGNVT